MKKMTSMNADKIGIKDRGRLKAGRVRRRHDLRPGSRHRPCHLRAAAPVPDRHQVRHRQRRRDHRQRAAHRRAGRPGDLRPGQESSRSAKGCDQVVGSGVTMASDVISDAPMNLRNNEPTSPSVPLRRRIGHCLEESLGPCFVPSGEGLLIVICPCVVRRVVAP